MYPEGLTQKQAVPDTQQCVIERHIKHTAAEDPATAMQERNSKLTQQCAVHHDAGGQYLNADCWGTAVL